MAPARTFPQKNGEKGLGHGRPVDSVLRGWRREVMEYAVFRLAMRSLLFLVAFALCVSHLVRKRDFIDAVFRSPDEVRKSFTGRNDVLFLRVLNIVPMVVAVATALAVWWFGLSPIWLIAAGAAAGILWTVKLGKGGRR